MRRAVLTLLTAALAAGALAIAAAPALGAYGLKSFGVTFTGPEGEEVAQAGSHPFAMTTSLAATTREEGGEIFLEGSPKDLFITTPEGLAGIPAATPRCTGAEFAAIQKRFSLPSCSDAAAVGLVAVLFAADPGAAPEEVVVPVYNLAPGPGAVLKLGFVVANVPVTAEATLSESPPYRVIARATNVSQTIKFFGSDLTLWGNPANGVHDPYRGSCINALPTSAEQKEFPGEPISIGKCPVSIPEKPLLTVPPVCGQPLRSDYATDSWQERGARLANGEPNLTDPAWATGSATSPALGGCGKVLASFGPQIATTPTNAQASSPSGLDVDVDVADPGLVSPAGIATSHIKKAVVTFPPGVTVNASQAEGLAACSEVQLAAETLTSSPGQGCPQAAKIGTLEVQTPLLEETLHGSLFVATPYANPTGELIALYMVIRDRELGILVKQAGSVTPDLATGQLISTFDNLPQVPFSRFHLHFREGGRSPLILPPACGTYTTTAQFTPWAAPASPRTTTSTFTVTSGPGGAPCPPAGPPPFSPSYVAGSLNNAAGHYSPFYLRLARNDGEAEITRFSSVLPPGLTGKIAGLPACPQILVEAAKARTGPNGGHEELAAPSCPAASRIGSTLAGAGAGPELTYVPGSLYLGGPYNGAPLSVIAITPAVAGPFDAGVVVVQEALDLNPLTAQVEVDGAASDPIPHILKGIPLSLRDLRIFVDRPDFTLNPTSCAEKASFATIWGSGFDQLSPADDGPLGLASRYQASSCASLPYEPKLKLTFRGATGRSGNPALRAVLRPRAGDANAKRLVTTLPPTEFIDNEHINNPCTRVQFNQDACPRSSILGRARAFSPLLDEPLEGPVYFRSNGGERGLPDIVLDLRGQFRIIQVGFIDTVSPKTNPRVRTTFATVPDAPIDKVVLSLYGGKRGLLENNANLCRKKRFGFLSMNAQNGRRLRAKARVNLPSCKAEKKSDKSRPRRG